MCDLTSVWDSLDSVMLGLGYDSCFEDGSCEACSEAEARAAYCHPTGRRQRVVCSACQAETAPPPFCLPGVRPLWRANASGAQAALAAAAAAGAGPGNQTARAAPSAGLFVRSCSSSGTLQHFLRGSTEASATNGAVGNRTRHSMQGSKRQAGPRGPRDETEEVLIFLALNGAVFVLSGCSLRRQRHKHWEQTMQVLYSHVGDEPAAGVRDRGCVSAASSPGPAATAGAGMKVQGPDRRAAAQSADASGTKPETFGRSISAVAARAGNALELAVMGEVATPAGTRQKIK